ncbi:MAG: hypothetical protein NZ900_05405 [Synergistetes bacterium]|nr:hypothetical protein [Synergistota bacterium]MDW8192356.1 hypothetical protein [Synergistota bacterium]
MANFVDALARVSVRVMEGGRRRVYAWRNVRPAISANDLDAVLNALLSLSASQVLEKFLVRQQNIV